VPEEYQRCLTGLNQVLKTCWYIVNKPNTDDKTKLQATAIIIDSYKFIMYLTTNGVVITAAIKYVTQKDRTGRHFAKDRREGRSNRRR
jgi:hypothetical protein